MALTSIQQQLRVIWDHVRFLTEAQMHPTVENIVKLNTAEKKFSRAERRFKRKVKTPSTSRAR
jgi:hypothetical protein